VWSIGNIQVQKNHRGVDLQRLDKEKARLSHRKAGVWDRTVKRCDKSAFLFEGVEIVRCKKYFVAMR
jgi:hypothetical protein